MHLAILAVIQDDGELRTHTSIVRHSGTTVMEPSHPPRTVGTSYSARAVMIAHGFTSAIDLELIIAESRTTTRLAT